MGIEVFAPALDDVDISSSYPPSAEFAAAANATAEMYDEAERDRLAFWGTQAERLSWETPFTDVLDWSEAPFAKWFVGGRLNVAYNCHCRCALPRAVAQFAGVLIFILAAD